MEDIRELTKEKDGLDENRVKAIFYDLHFGSDSPDQQVCQRFANCFVTYEERTRIVTVKNEDGTTTEEEETYTVAVPIEDLEAVYENISSAMGVEVTEGQRSNAESATASYTGGNSSVEGTDVPFIGGGQLLLPYRGELAERGHLRVQQPYRPHHGRAAGPYRHAPCNAYRRLDPCCPAGIGDGMHL